MDYLPRAVIFVVIFVLSLPVRAVDSTGLLFEPASQFVAQLCSSVQAPDVNLTNDDAGADGIDAVLPDTLPEALQIAFRTSLQNLSPLSDARLDPAEVQNSLAVSGLEQAQELAPGFFKSAITRGRAGQQSRLGTRYTWSVGAANAEHAGEEAVTLSVLGLGLGQGQGQSAAAPGNRRQAAFVLQTGVQRPQLLLRLDAECQPVLQRSISYDETGRQLALHELDAGGAAIDSPHWLNPPLPEPVVFDESVEKPLGESVDGPAVKVAIIDSGVNYLLPHINKGLARNQQGQLLGYDFWDNDDLPFDAHPVASAFQVERHGTRTAGLFLEEAPFAQLIPYRYPRGNMHRMEAVLERVDAQGVVLVGMPLGGNRRDEWEVFYNQAKRYPHMLFVVSAGNNDRDIDQQPVYPAALDLPNMVVVTSANDTARPARGSNWGRQHVDYLIPAENIELGDYDGSRVNASGSSYAVPKMLAMLARMLRQNPGWQATELQAELRRRYNDGASARYVTGGYIGDPLSAASDQPVLSLQDSVELQIQQEKIQQPNQNSDVKEKDHFTLKLNVVVLDESWTRQRIQPLVNRLAEVLTVCSIKLLPVQVGFYNSLPHLKTMGIGHAKTLREELSLKRPSVYLLRQTRLLRSPEGELFRFDAEAFGRGNTRYRNWLLDTVWVSADVIDADLAVAHELMHVLMNSGEHTNQPGNLMNAATSPDNIRVNPRQCQLALENGLANGLLQRVKAADTSGASD